MGEHYAIDEILGALLAVAVFFASPWLTKQIGVGLVWIKTKSKHLHSSLRSKAG
jgi:hypothetical protein